MHAVATGVMEFFDGHQLASEVEMQSCTDRCICIVIDDL
jgi:hypothetical protein